MVYMVLRYQNMKIPKKDQPAGIYYMWFLWISNVVKEGFNWRSNSTWDKDFLTCGLPRDLTKQEVGEMMHVSFFHQSTKNRLMKEYLIYFHFRLMHHRNVTRLANQASRWDWHLPENGRNCSRWSSFQFCADSFPICWFTTLIVLPICSEAICRSSIVGHIWKFLKFLHTPPRFVEAAYFASQIFNLV